MPGEVAEVTYEKYTEEELRKALLFIDGAFDSLYDVFDIIKDEDLKKRAKEALEDETIPAETIYYLIEEFYDDIAKHMDKKDFIKLNTIYANTHQMVNTILSHPEYYEGGLSAEDRLTLMSVERSNARALFTWSSLPVGQALRALEYSKEEKKAVEEYAGQDDYELSDSDVYIEFVYETYNMLFFPGLENERARIYEEMRRVYPEILTDTERLLDFSRNLYKALYKSSRKLPDDLEVRRIDRVATIEAMEKSKKVMSSFSTTLSKKYGDFSKKHSAIVEGLVHKGVVAGDFAEILKGTYAFDEESELLIAPGAKVTIDEMEITDRDRMVIPSEYNSLDRKVHMEFFADSPYIDPLSDEERLDQSVLRAFLVDKENSTKAGQFLTELDKARRQNVKDGMIEDDPTMPFEEAIDTINPEIVSAYLKFKEAFVKYYRYMTRDVAMEVESSLDRADENYREGRVEKASDLWDYGVMHPRSTRYVRQNVRLLEEESIDMEDEERVDQTQAEETKKYITEEELIEVLRGEKLETLKSAIDTFGKVVGEQDLSLDEELGQG